MSTPIRSNDRELLTQTAVTLSGMPAATGDITDPGELRARETTHEEIARAAYQLFEERGHELGHEWEDWFRAERGQ